MALITCKECGKEISDKADFCPHCGYKNPVESQINEDCAKDFPSDRSVFQQQFQNQQQYQNQQQFQNQQQYQNQYNHDERNAETHSIGKSGVFGIIGFVLSIVSLFLALWGTVAIAGLIFSIIGLVVNGGEKNKGKNFAVSGIILSSISLLYTFVQLVVL